MTPNLWQELDEDLRRHADRGRILAALWLAIPPASSTQPDFTREANGVLDDVLMGESQDLPQRTGWLLAGPQSDAIFGPFTSFAGRWDPDDISNWLESEQLLSDLIGEQPRPLPNAGLRPDRWILYLFRCLLGTGRLFENGLEGYWANPEPLAKALVLEPLSDVETQREPRTRRIDDHEQHQLYRFLCDGQLDLGIGAYMLLMRTDLRRASRSAIKPFLTPEPPKPNSRRKRNSPEQDRIRKQRIKFATPRLDQYGAPKTSWPQIYEEYRKKHPKDSKASPATLRLTVRRDPERSDSSDT